MSHLPGEVGVKTENDATVPGAKGQVRRATVAWRWRANSRRAYWLGTGRSKGTRGFELSLQLDNDPEDDSSWGRPIWGPGSEDDASQPRGTDWKHIPDVIAANFKCPYAEDYFKDDRYDRLGTHSTGKFDNPYSITVGSSCRPTKRTLPDSAQRRNVAFNKFRFHWTHLLDPNRKDNERYDDEDQYSVSIVPTHYATNDHYFIINNLDDRDEPGICTEHGKGRLGSCMFEDHMEEYGSAGRGPSRPAKYLNNPATTSRGCEQSLARGTTGNGVPRTRRFVSRSKDPIAPGATSAARC